MNKILIFFASLFISACSSFNTQENSLIIPRDSFVMVLTDMHLADVLLVNERKFDRNLGDTTGKKSYYNSIYKKHNINEYRFTETIKFYGSRSDEYLEIYNDVINELSKRRSELDTLKNTNPDVKPDDKSKLKNRNVNSR